MNNLLTRILMSIIMIPLASALYMVLFILLINYLQDVYAFLWADIFIALFVVLYWLELWRRHVCWTRRRRIWTVLSIIGSIICSMVVCFVIAIQKRYFDLSLFIFLIGSISISLWLLATLLIWRETSTERAERIRQSAGKSLFCPQCHYNMRGLYEARCPECGSKYTLDQLLASQEQNRIEDISSNKQT